MTVSALRVPVVTGLVAAARSAVGEAAGVPVGWLLDAELAEATAALAGLESQVAALRLALLAEADRRELAAKAAATGTDAWAAALTGDTREAAAGGVRIARLLRDRYAATRAAFAAGRLLTAQVRVIVNAAEQAPAEATPEQLAAAEQWLVDKATGDGNRSGRPMNAKRLRQAARRMFDVVDRELADRHEAILLGREAKHAERETYLSLSDNGDGTFSGRFVIPELHGHLLREALERLTAPRRLGRDRTGCVTDESALGTGHGVNLNEARGQAFCELLEHLPSDGHAANGVTLIVTLGLQQLLSELGAARLDTGTHISAGDARRLACTAGIVPAVLDGDSLPLDLGRERRLHTTHQRRALALLHDTCAIAGCERPFAWCEIHVRREALIDRAGVRDPCRCPVAAGR